MNAEATRTKARIKAVIVLALVTPVLTELFSTNMGPGQVVRPGAFVFLLLAYSLPVLLIRELAVRARVGLPGLFLMGLAYGIFNEGVLAKTLFFGMPGGGALEAYSGFAPARIHLVWAVLIITWHALHAVVFPIALVSALFPSVRRDSWLSRLARIIFIVVLVLFSVVGFLKVRPEYADWPYFVGFAALISVFLLIAVRLPAGKSFFTPAASGRAGQVIFGIVLHPLLVVAFFVTAKHGAPIATLVAWPIGLVLILYAWLVRRGWTTVVPVAFIALGDYGSGALVNLLVKLGAHPRPMDKIVFLIVLLIFLALITWRALAGQKAPGPEPTGEIV